VEKVRKSREKKDGRWGLLRFLRQVRHLNDEGFARKKMILAWKWARIQTIMLINLKTERKREERKDREAREERQERGGKRE